MYSVYKKGGNIISTKIAECGEDDWEKMEQDLISQYSLTHKLLNVDKGGAGVITKEKRNISGIQRSAEAHKKAIVLLDTKGILVDICDSVNTASKKYKLSRTSIGNVLSGRSKTCGGYYIILQDTYKSPDFNVKEFIDNINNSKRKQKTIYQFNLSGELINSFKSKRNAFFRIWL